MRRLGDLVPDSYPLRAMRQRVNQALVNLDTLLPACTRLTSRQGASASRWRSCCVPCSASLLQHPVGTPTYGAEPVQPAVSIGIIRLSVDDAVWVRTVFTRNRERLIQHDALIELFNEALDIANKQNLRSSEHFSVDGTLIQDWAGHKSLVRKDGSSGYGGNFKGRVAAMTRTQPRSTPMQGFIAKATLPANCAPWVTPSLTTAID